MGFLSWRRKRVRLILEELEDLLKKNHVTPCHLFKDRNLLNYLTCAPFNTLLHRLKISTVDIDLTGEERDFVEFIKEYKAFRKRKNNLLLDTPPAVPYYDSPHVGWRENLNYKEEMEKYMENRESFNRRREKLEQKRERLWNTPEAEVFRLVRDEQRRALCPFCLGLGSISTEVLRLQMEQQREESLRQAEALEKEATNGRAACSGDSNTIPMNNTPGTSSTGNNANGFTAFNGNGSPGGEAENGDKDVLCPRCGGAGISGYEPTFSREQERIAREFREKLIKLDEPVFDSFPCKRVPVFIRINFFGQIFIKTAGHGAV